MSPAAIRLMRAIKQLYPDVEAGKMVDPYSAAYHAALYPNAPAYDVTLRELPARAARRRSVEAVAGVRFSYGRHRQHKSAL